MDLITNLNKRLIKVTSEELPILAALVKKEMRKEHFVRIAEQIGLTLGNSVTFKPFLD